MARDVALRQSASRAIIDDHWRGGSISGGAGVDL